MLVSQSAQLMTTLCHCSQSHITFEGDDDDDDDE